MTIRDLKERIWQCTGFAFTLLLFSTASLHGVPDTRPSFEEVSDLIESNLVNATPETVNWLAVQGLLNELSPRVSLVDGPDASSQTASEASSVAECKVLRGTIGYFKYDHIGQGTVQQMKEHYSALNATNQLTGLILDLRGSAGDDYAAALGVADLFLAKETPLMNWGEGLRSSIPKDDAIALPAVVLVDGKTGGSAEALAAMLRESGVALVIGGRTSGTAGIKRTFPLKNGQYLRITVSSVQLAASAQVIPIEGLTPDIEVKAGASGISERVGSATGNSTTNTRVSLKTMRLDEADLVRRWRGEMLSAEDLQAKPRVLEAEERDPVLVRALDLLEGLAILGSMQK